VTKMRSYGEFDEVIKRIRETIKSLEEAVSRHQRILGGDVIEPLYMLNEYPDRYEVIVDMPLADLDLLSIDIKGQRLLLECRLKREVRFEKWSIYRSVGHKVYRLELRLPPDIDAGKTEIEKYTSKSMIRIKIPRRRE